MEAELTLIGPEGGGRIVALHVREGDDVVTDALLFELDSSVQAVQVAEATARLAEARAQLDNLTDQQMRAQEIAVLEARKRRAEAALEFSRKELERKSRLFLRRVVPESQVETAQAAVDRDAAELAEAQRQIDVAHLAARSAQIKAAEAMVEAAEAGVRQARIALDKRRVRAPEAGRIQEVYFRSGEVVTASRPVLGLYPPGRLKARFFVPEPRLSSISIGTVVTLSCDGCASGLTARVDFVSSEAAFTPPVIYGPKERAKLVFRVEARAEGPATALSPGQPVSVIPPRSAREDQNR